MRNMNVVNGILNHAIDADMQVCMGFDDSNNTI